MNSNSNRNAERRTPEAPLYLHHPHTAPTALHICFPPAERLPKKGSKTRAGTALLRARLACLGAEPEVRFSKQQVFGVGVVGPLGHLAAT